MNNDKKQQSPDKFFHSIIVFLTIPHIKTTHGTWPCKYSW